MFYMGQYNRIKLLGKRIAQLEKEKFLEEQGYAKREAETKRIIKGILGYDPDEIDDGHIMSPDCRLTEEEIMAISNLINDSDDC